MGLNKNKNDFSSHIMGRKKVEINSNTKLNKIKTTLYNIIRNSKNIDGRSFQKYINQVSGIKAKEENRKKLMDLYDTISEISSKEGEKATFKTVAEVRNQKRES